MRQLLFLTLIFFSFSPLSLASALRVGDQIILKGTHQGGSVEIKARYESFQGQSMLQRQTTLLNGSIMETEDTWVAAEDLLTPENAGLMVALCQNIGGTHEYLDLPVGRTLTCRLESSQLEELPLLYSFTLKNMGDVLWVGPFPVLGVAQLETAGALLKVSDYHWN